MNRGAIAARRIIGPVTSFFTGSGFEATAFIIPSLYTIFARVRMNKVTGEHEYDFMY
jgi:hypothetical protein